MDSDDKLYQPVPQSSHHEDFLKDIVAILFKRVIFAGSGEKVVLWKEPEVLDSIFDFALDQYGASHEKLLVLIKDTVKYSVKTGHPYFINQLFSGLDPYGLAGQWLTDALNASVYTYEVAPVFTLMERHVIEEMCKMIGPQWSDGMFCPGGSTANGTAINLARFRRDPASKKTGRSDGNLVMFASEECHYSVQKFASFVGIGEDNVCSIKTDSVGQMDGEELGREVQQQIALGKSPFLVIATLGSTVRGAFDPINELSDICKKYGMWLHVDAAWGGGLIFSQKYRTKLNGIENADSIVINPHKLLAVPQQCSMLFVKHPGLLHQCHSKDAQYLFQKDKHYDRVYDPGDKYLQCGRKCDVFKFWFMWKAKGSTGFAKHVETLMDLAQYLESQIRSRRDFELVSERQYMNVCFWYLPKYLQGRVNLLSDHSTQLQKVAPNIKSVMVKHGAVMLSYQPLKEIPNFFRFVSQNSALTKSDIDFILDHVADIGRQLFP